MKTVDKGVAVRSGIAKAFRALRKAGYVEWNGTFEETIMVSLPKAKLNFESVGGF